MTYTVNEASRLARALPPNIGPSRARHSRERRDRGAAALPAAHGCVRAAARGRGWAQGRIASKAVSVRVSEKVSTNFVRLIHIV